MAAPIIPTTGPPRHSPVMTPVRAPIAILNLGGGTRPFGGVGGGVCKGTKCHLHDD